MEHEPNPRVKGTGVCMDRVIEPGHAIAAGKTL